MRLVLDLNPSRYCSLKYAATIASPGNTFLIQSGRYSQGTTVFNRSGTATAPITWRAVGDVTFGLDVRDEDFQPVSGMANVYSIPWTNPLSPGQVSQTKFAPILVDDPNQSKFTIVQEDGPIRLSPVKTDAHLLAHEGTWRLNGGQLFVRAYGDRVPSTTTTDFVAGVSGGTGVTFDTKAQYNVFDGFRVLFSFTVVGSHNTFRNLKFQGQPFDLRGTNNTAENITITHVIVRDETTFAWFTDGQGTAGGMTGSGHKVTNLHVWHNWNSSFSSEGAPGAVVDGARLHGAPNHCSIAANGSSIVRNAIFYNCQDYEWLIDTNGLTFEHVVLPSGIAFSAVTGTLGPVIVRTAS